MLEPKLIKKDIEQLGIEQESSITYLLDPSISPFMLLSNVLSKFKSTHLNGEFKIKFHIGGVVQVSYTETKKIKKNS